MAREGSLKGRRPRRFFVIPLLACTGVALAITAAAAVSRTNAQSISNWARPAERELAQSAEPAPDNQSVSPAEIKKYIAVYTAMQRDRTLTVEKSAKREGMTISQFRELENRILREPSAHARVMKALRAAAEARHKKAASKLGHSE